MGRLNGCILHGETNKGKNNNEMSLFSMQLFFLLIFLHQDVTYFYNIYYIYCMIVKLIIYIWVMLMNAL